MADYARRGGGRANYSVRFCKIVTDIANPYGYIANMTHTNLTPKLSLMTQLSLRIAFARFALRCNSAVHYLIFSIMLSSVQVSFANTPQTVTLSSENKTMCDTGTEKACVQYAVDIFFAVEKTEDEADSDTDFFQNEILKALELDTACKNGSPTGCSLTAFSVLAEQSTSNTEAINFESETLSQKKIQFLTKNSVPECKKNSAFACFIAGIFYKESEDRIEIDEGKALIEKGLSLANKDCVNGDVRICHILGHLYEDEDVISDGKEQAFDYFRLTIENECSTPLSCFEIAKKYESLKIKRTINRYHHLGIITAFYTKACDMDEIRACTNLGRFENAKYRNKSEQRIQLFSKACDGGDMLGCINLAFFYIFENNSLKPDARSIALFTKACNDPTYRRACYIVGNAYYYGNSVPLNRNIAKNYYRKSCPDQDQECLKTINRTGRPKEKDISELIGQLWH